MITSPCINVCQMDKDQRLCIGCFRTIEEITVWSHVEDAARARILADVAERRREYEANNKKPCDKKNHE